MTDIDVIPACVECAHYKSGEYGARCVVYYPAHRHPVYGWQMNDGSNSCRSMRKAPSRWFPHRCGLYGRLFEAKQKQAEG